MRLAISTIWLLLLFPLHNMAQNKKNLPGAEKYAGSELEKARSRAVTLKTVNDSLTDKINMLLAKRTAVKEELNLTESQIKDSTLYLPLGLLLFSLVLILAILIFLFKLEKGFENYAFQTIGLIIVINAALFLIVTGYNKDQITPIIGLLGTIVGFIFGSNLTTKKNAKTGEKPDDQNNQTSDLR